jgi:hypothetical protein
MRQKLDMTCREGGGAGIEVDEWDLGTIGYVHEFLGQMEFAVLKGR